MKYKFLITVMSLAVMSLTACGNTADTVSKTNTLPSTEVDVNIEMREDISVEWQELGDMTNHAEIREVFDNLVGNKVMTDTGIEMYDGKKGGVAYVNMNNQWTNNSTLRYSFNQLNFHKMLWNNTDNLKSLIETSKNYFADVQTDSDAVLAAINAYYNLFAMPEGYFNGGDTLSRAEFMTGVYKAHNPVSQLEANIELKSDEYNPFVNQMMPYSFIDMKDETNYSGTITRGEAIYTLVKMYYSNETADGDVKLLLDAKDGGAITLLEALQNPDGGMPSDMYKAIVIAESHGIIDGAESNWDEAITKADALEMITKVYEEANLASSVEFEAASTSNNASTEAETDYYAEVSSHIQKDANGKITFSQELKDTINNSLDRQGLARGYGQNVLNTYYEQTKDKDNSKVYEDIVDSITASIKEELKSENKQQNQAQQNQGGNSGSSNQGGSNNNNNSGSSNNGGNSGSGKTEVDNDGYIFEDNNEYPSGSVDEEVTPPDTFFEEGGGGSLADQSLPIEDSSGEHRGTTDVTINP